jgi:CMP-N-acetylneuraminic acid synthetase
MQARGNGLAVGIIPARGGSKRIHRKNLKPLGGLPLVVHSIRAALAATELDRLIVSTDDQEIAELCRQHGAEVPFLRPSEFAVDTAPDLPVFQHALGWLAEQEGYRPEFVIHLRPTQPFRPPGMIDRVIGLLRQKEVDCVKSVTPVAQHPHKMWRFGPAGELLPFQDTPLWRQLGPDCAGQFLEKVYWSAGLVDGIRSDTILAGSTIGQRIEPFPVDDMLCPELDTPIQFVIAEVLYQHLCQEGVLTP